MSGAMRRVWGSTPGVAAFCFVPGIAARRKRVRWLPHGSYRASIGILTLAGFATENTAAVLDRRPHTQECATVRGGRPTSPKRKPKIRPRVAKIWRGDGGSGNALRKARPLAVGLWLYLQARR